MKGFTLVPLLLIGMALVLVGAESWYFHTTTQLQQAPSFATTTSTSTSLQTEAH